MAQQVTPSPVGAQRARVPLHAASEGTSLPRTVPKRPLNTRLVYSTGSEPTQPRQRAETQESPGKASQGIRLRLDRRASGRVVTVVSGLPGTKAEVTELARRLKAACGAGGTVKDGALELQGDQREKVEAALTERGLRSKRSGG
jgi:translation initiation factor 1